MSRNIPRIESDTPHTQKFYPPASDEYKDFDPDHRLVERALFASEERFSKVFHSSPVAVCITRLQDGLIIEANERFLALTGYKRDDLFDRTELDLAFYEVGFESAVEWLAEQTQNKWRIHVKVIHDSSPKPLEEALKVTLFTVVKELLANAVKHANATRITVSLARRKKHIHIAVKDDGVGFNVDKVAATGKPSGFGFFSIRERITHLGGTLRISSRPAAGSKVLIIAPLKMPIQERTS